ncbi:MAG: hypothetical protein LC791_04560 [Acidobacteria bacterium]|nr:hypothetical protein [Acidobacteriota bacterium]
MDSGARADLGPLVDDLRRIFANRLIAVAAYGRALQRLVPSLVLVESLSLDDLDACAARAKDWQRARVAAPLVLTRDEFGRSADAFPIEYAEMRETATVLFGSDPFLLVGEMSYEDLRRACEVQIRSHLLYLREEYLECGGRPRDIAALVVDSAPGFAVLLRHLARLEGASPANAAELAAFVGARTHLDVRVFDDVMALANPDQTSTVDPTRIFPAYLEAVTSLARLVDAWRELPTPSASLPAFSREPGPDASGPAQST